jgi:hypothetical protein
MFPSFKEKKICVMIVIFALYCLVFNEWTRHFFTFIFHNDGDCFDRLLLLLLLLFTIKTLQKTAKNWVNTYKNIKERGNVNGNE